MTTRRPSGISKAARALTACLSLGCATFSAIEARADGYAECNQILTQDIFNKITKNDSSSSTSAAEASEAFFSQDETQAFDTYSKAFSEAKKNGTKIDAEFHYGVIGGELGIDVTSEKQVSESEFKQKFNKAKSTRQGNRFSKASSGQTLVSTYASSIRDPGTVSAWKECITKTKDTDLYVFASRDRAGKVYITVMWVPGVFAGSSPSIPIKFVTDGDADGIKIHAKPQEEVAMGSGANFAVSCGKKCDDGFQVTVNGKLKDPTGRLTNSFTKIVEVPSAVPPPKAALIKAPQEAAIPSGQVAIVNANSGLCLTVAGGGKERNTTAVQYYCDNDPSRAWNFILVDGTDIAHIRNLHSGLCLTVAGGVKDNSTPGVQYYCDNDPSRRWRVTRVDERTFQLVNINSNLCLTVAGGGTDKNVTVGQYPCDGDRSRNWQFRTAP